MANVNAITCQIVRINAPTAKKERVVTWWVPGHNGIGAHKLGQNDSEWECELVYFGTKAYCDAFAVAIDALQAAIVTILDNKGDPYSGMLIEHVSNRQIRPAWHAKNIAGVSLGINGWSCRITIKGKMT